MRYFARLIVTTVVTISASVALAADPIVGVWKTEPDRKNLVSHVKISACGDKFCGQILSAYNSSGKEVQTPNIGKKLFWDVSNKGGGSYGGGEFWVPLINVDAVPQMTLNGNTLSVKGCEHMLCAHQTWSRLE